MDDFDDTRNNKRISLEESAYDQNKFEEGWNSSHSEDLRDELFYAACFAP